MTIKVLIVDDSAVVRKFLTDILSKDPSIDVVGVAPNPFVARDKIIKYNPDVITLDVEMPRMDGITFLEKLMSSYPMPVIIVSALTQKGTETAIRALEAGAVGVIAKPAINLKKGLESISEEIINKVKEVASARVFKRAKKAKFSKSVSPTKNIKTKSLLKSTHKVIAIGASTGGTEAIKEVLTKLPANSPGIVVVQHMPPVFTKSFASRLNELCAVDVKEACEGDPVLPGTVLLAPGDYHMTLARSGARYYVRLNQEAPINHQRPAVDILFKSVATYAGGNAVGVILTGMGNDGARGLRDMKDEGAVTIVQDEKSSVVFGMPKEAIKLGCVDKVIPLESIAGSIMRSSKEKKKGKKVV